MRSYDGDPYRPAIAECMVQAQIHTCVHGLLAWIPYTSNYMYTCKVKNLSVHVVTWVSWTAQSTSRFQTGRSSKQNMEAIKPRNTSSLDCNIKHLKIRSGCSSYSLRFNCVSNMMLYFLSHVDFNTLCHSAAIYCISYDFIWSIIIKLWFSTVDV